NCCHIMAWFGWFSQCEGAMNDSKNDTRNDKSRDEIEQEKQDEAILDSAIASADTHESNKAAMKESVEEEKEIVTQKVRSTSDTWAANVDRVKVKEQPGGAFAATLEDRMIVSPLEGFGPLWRRTYRVRIPG